MVTIIHAYLKNHSLFSVFNDFEIKEICELINYKTVKKDEIIYSHKQVIDRIYFLNHGRIKIANCIEKNVEVVSEILKEGDIFGELTLKASPNIQCEFAQALSDDAMIFSFGLKDFENILKKNPGIVINYSQMVAEKLKIINGKYCDLVFKDVRSRVLNFFMLHAQYEGKWTGNKAEIDMFCTHQDIANFTASRRQTVSTIIRDLVNEKKIIYKGRSKLIIPDIKKLHA